MHPPPSPAPVVSGDEDDGASAIVTVQTTRSGRTVRPPKQIYVPDMSFEEGPVVSDDEFFQAVDAADCAGVTDSVSIEKVIRSMEWVSRLTDKHVKSMACEIVEYMEQRDIDAEESMEEDEDEMDSSDEDFIDDGSDEESESDDDWDSDDMEESDDDDDGDADSGLDASDDGGDDE